MTTDERCDFVLAFAKVLFINGQATDQTVAAAARLGQALGVKASVTARWGALRLDLEAAEGALAREVAADPAGVDMDRVSAAMRLMEDIEADRLAPEAAGRALAAIARRPPAPTWAFALAAAAGAVALSVIFGISHVVPAALVFASAGAGALLRRALGDVSANNYLLPFSAALLAGIIGALAVRAELSSSLRLVAVCPCMVLVPGPHILNAALDLAGGRIHLGAARLLHAILIVAAISTGLLLGLALLGVSLPVDPSGRDVLFWQDVIAAGVAVAAYGVFFSTPPRMLPWPIAVGMLAHALRWAAIAVLGFGVASGALVACIAVALILTPVSRRTHMPFAAIGFASVVSMIPGVYLFRMMSGLVALAGGGEAGAAELPQTIGAGAIAAIVILAMSLGLVVPKMIIDAVLRPWAPPVAFGAAGRVDAR